MKITITFFNTVDTFLVLLSQKITMGISAFDSDIRIANTGITVLQVRE
jgi:hypothetical protein